MRQFASVLCIAFSGVLAACSSSDELSDDFGNDASQSPTAIKLANDVQLNCSSNSVVLGQYDAWYYKVQDWENATKEHMPSTYACFADNAPAKGNGEAVSEAEKEKVLAYIAAHPNEGTTEFNHYNYFIQYVGGSYDNYTAADYPGLTDHNGAAKSVIGSAQFDYIVFVDQNGEEKRITDYNAGGGPRQLILNTKIADAQYHDSWGDKNNMKSGLYRFYTIDGNLYLCYDYATEKNSGETFAGDGVYNDYVIKIIPACGNDDSSDKDNPSTPDTPVVPSDTTIANNGHVEVNLAVNDRHENGDWIASHLSVHVRDTVNFEIFLPVRDIYYCAADDMLIVEKHDVSMTYNKVSTQIERVIAGQTVKFYVNFAPEGIYITSEGINSKVLEYCRNVYADGLTFEVWNYYNSSLTRENLVDILNQSTIKFTDRKPKEYRNTIVDTNRESGTGVLLDCIVTDVTDKK